MTFWSAFKSFEVFFSPKSSIHYGHSRFIFLQVVSGDLVFDVPPGALAAAHRKHNAVVTTMLCPAPVSGPTESGSSGGKDKIKKPRRYNIIGLDPSKQFLLHIATGFMFEFFMLVLVPLICS
jgi:hypothetical protein